MSREAYKRMYGKPADIDKVWGDRDELHDLTVKHEVRDWWQHRGQPRIRLGRSNARRYHMMPMDYRVGLLTHDFDAAQRTRHRKITTTCTLLLIVTYLMFRVVT